MIFGWEVNYSGFKKVAKNTNRTINKLGVQKIFIIKPVSYCMSAACQVLG